MSVSLPKAGSGPMFCFMIAFEYLRLQRQFSIPGDHDFQCSMVLAIPCKSFIPPFPVPDALASSMWVGKKFLIQMYTPLHQQGERQQV